jgi:hypothetical protein
MQQSKRILVRGLCSLIYSKLKTEKDSFRDQILDSELFKITGQSVEDARLETNALYKKLVGLLNDF